MKKHLICFMLLLTAAILCACDIVIAPNYSKDESSYTSSIEDSFASTDGENSTEETSAEYINKLPLKFSGLPYGDIVYTTDISGLNASNPWSAESGITEMPVIEKRSLLNKYEMSSTLRTLANGLGLTLSSDIRDDGDRCTAIYTEGVVISVSEYGYIQLLYANGGLALPKEYSFDSTSRDAAVSRLGWFADTYASHFGIAESVQCVEPHYSESGELSYSAISVTGAFANTFLYPKGNDIKEDILNYFVYPVNFTESVSSDSEYNITPNGTLGGVYAYVPTVSLVNEYPIISVEEAKFLLLDKKCYCLGTLNLDLLIKAESIGKTELVYNKSNDGGVCMPFYCFWIKSPDEENAYYSCYVPAIEEQCLDTSAIPNWH